MGEKYKSIWEKAEPLLKKAKRKDFVLHTKMVVRAMEEIIAGEGGDSDTLIPAAILHDTGWSEVPLDIQLSNDKDKSHEALAQHIEKAQPIIRNVLGELGYHKQEIERIVDIVTAHKFTDPKDKDKQMLIDADTLSDTYKESFCSDTKSYNQTPQDTYEFRSKNIFYTKTARELFKRHLVARLKEIEAEDGSNTAN